MHPINLFSHRLLTPFDAATAARVISTAFLQDPLVSFMLPLKWTRRRTLEKFFRPYSELIIARQRAYGVGDPLQGVAYWVFPGQDDLSISLKAAGKFLPLLFTLYPLGYLRAKAIIQQTGALHQKYAGEPHFYLDNIGVLPTVRGQGLSSALIRPILEMADAQQAPVYTDTVTPGNVSFYEHFGFECMQACPVAGTGITVFALRRPVRM